jgi:hypothetical protein
VTADLNRAAAYCPTCGAEYREGFDICADDDTTLIPGPLPEDFELPAAEETEPEFARPQPTTGARWVRAKSYLHEEEARLAAGRLEADGIPARIYPEEFGTYYGSAVTAIMRDGIDVMVPEDRLLEARERIEELERA